MRSFLAKNLRKGAKIFLFSTLLATVDSTFAQDTTCTVYNFEVENTHNYFVGKEGVLVHNLCKTLEDLINGTGSWLKNELLSKKLAEVFDIDLAMLKQMSKIKDANGKILRNISIGEIELNIFPTKKNLLSTSGTYNDFDNAIPLYNGYFSPNNVPKTNSILGGFTFDCNSKGGLATSDFGKIARLNDTEVKILESIAKEIQQSGIASNLVSGKIKIHTELFPCRSCTNVIKEFKTTYPNIEIEIYTQAKLSF